MGFIYWFFFRRLHFVWKYFVYKCWIIITVKGIWSKWKIQWCSDSFKLTITWVNFVGLRNFLSKDSLILTFLLYQINYNWIRDLWILNLFSFGRCLHGNIIQLMVHYEMLLDNFKVHLVLEKGYCESFNLI